jgi:hypothetical protein
VSRKEDLLPPTLDATAVRSWCRLSLRALGRAREEIDAINVYPVADGDTGTNLYLTVESAAQAVEAVFDAHATYPEGADGADGRAPSFAEAFRALAHGALIGARGNSGTILAQLLRGMNASLTAPRPEDTHASVRLAASDAPNRPSPLRGPGGQVAELAAGAPHPAHKEETGGGAKGADSSVAGEASEVAGSGRVDAEDLRRALVAAAGSAYEAVARPVEGTMLTVATCAAEAARAAGGGLPEVVRAAHTGALAALAVTPAQLGALRRAGVVDAGGLGLVALLGALCETVTGEAPADGPLASAGAAFRHTHPDAADRPDSAPPATVGPQAPAPDRTTPATPAGGDRPPTLGAPRGPEAYDGPARAGNSPAADGAHGPWAPESPAGRGNPPGAGAPRADDGPGRRGGEGARPGPLEADGADGVFGEPRGELCADAPDAGGDGPAFEVVFLLEGAGAEAVDVLRGRLDALGDSLVVVGGDGLWSVHVHADDVGAVVEAAIGAGRPYRIRVTHFGDQVRQPRAERAVRAVVAVVRGDGLAELCGQAGATVVALRPGERPASGEIAAAIRRAHAREVVLLPNDTEVRHAAAAAAEQARADGVRVALIPTRAAVQGLAALAVHEPTRRFDEDVVAMTAAAGATRYAELAVAEHRSWTMAGVCQAGDVLGLIDGDVAVIGADLAGTAVATLERMLAAGGELVTLVLGPTAPDGLGDRLCAHVHAHHLAVDTTTYEGGDPAVPLLIGVE